MKHTDDGDRRVQFERIYAGYYQPILAYALRRTETRDDAADVVAETFLTAWRRQDQTPDGPAVRLWLYGIARRVLANHLRGRRRHERLGARLRAGDTGADHDSRPTSVITETRTAIASAFSRLRADDRDLLTLVAAEGLTPSEAAQALGSSSATVRVRLHRARARFARELTADGVEV